MLPWVCHHQAHGGTLDFLHPCTSARAAKPGPAPAFNSSCPDCRCVGGLGLSVVCRLLSEDSGGWRGGMPDLLLWRPERGDALVSEVKVRRRLAGGYPSPWLAQVGAVQGVGPLWCTCVCFVCGCVCLLVPGHKTHQTIMLQVRKRRGVSSGPAGAVLCPALLP